MTFEGVTTEFTLASIFFFHALFSSVAHKTAPFVTAYRLCVDTFRSLIYKHASLFFGASLLTDRFFGDAD